MATTTSTSIPDDPQTLRPLPTDIDRKIFQVDPYDLITVLLETLAYGIFFVLFLLSKVLLLQRRSVYWRQKLREPAKLRSIMVYLVIGVIMFFTITAKWMFWWPEILPIPTADPSVIPQLPRLNRTAYRFKEVLIQITILLGDMITTYRLWVLSNRNKVMVTFPLLCIFGFVASSIALSGPANDTRTTPIPIIYGKLKMTDWDVSAISCTFAMTVYDTVMIAFIILRAQFRVRPNLVSRGLRQALVVIIESAAIYAAWNLCFFISGLGFQSEVTLSFLDCMPAVYGISVMLINVRVGLGWARNSDDYDTSTNLPSHSLRFAGGRGFWRRGINCTSTFSTEQREVCFSTVVYTNPGDTTSTISTMSGHGRRAEDCDMDIADERFGVTSSFSASEKGCVTV